MALSALFAVRGFIAFVAFIEFVNAIRSISARLESKLIFSTRIIESIPTTRLNFKDLFSLDTDFLDKSTTGALVLV